MQSELSFEKIVDRTSEFDTGVFFFRMKRDGIVVMSFNFNPDTITLKKWNSFLHSVESNMPDNIVIKSSHTEVRIDTGNEITRFSVGDSDNALSCGVSNSMCVNAFREAALETRAFKSIQYL